MWKASLILLCALVALSLASDADFVAIDFIASAPYTYDHLTGGGAYNDRTIGEYFDTVESLEGKQFMCEDLVSYMVKIEMEQVVVDATQTVRMQNAWLADTTGQSGVAFIDIVNVVLNKGDVENGDDATGVHPGRGGFGTDGAYKSNGNEVLKVNRRWATGPIFQKGSEVRVEWEVSGLEAGEVVIVRFDVVLGCHPDLRSPTGNLQGALNWARALANDDAIGGGEQTVPLKTVSGIGGLELCELTEPELTGTDFTATVTYTDTSMTNGGFVTADFAYSWSSGSYVIDAQSNPTKSLHTFDTECTVYHDGEYMFSQGLCGCEETFIGADQPQLFYNADSTYYLPNPTTETINGIQVYHYVASGTQAITDLYLAVSDGKVVRAVWKDGRIMNFTDVLFGAVAPETFAQPGEECTCKRRLDLALVLEKSDDIIFSQWQAVKLFTDSFARSYDIAPAHTQMTIIEFGSAAKVILPINQGNVLTNVLSAAASLSCPNGGTNGQSATKPCGTGGASIPVAIDTALAELNKSTRGAAAARAIVIVTNGWASTKTEVEAAVARANAQDVTVYTVAYSSTMVKSDLLTITAGDPDLLVQRFSALDLGAIDPIDINSRVCLANVQPCGSQCCGHCDSTCGECIPVDDCVTDDTGCFTTIALVGSCCKTVESTDTCEPAAGTCGTSECVKDACAFTPSCVNDVNDECHSYECVDGSCIQSVNVANGADACNLSKCVDGALVLSPVNCGTSTACDIVSCDLVEGCITTPITDPSPSNDLCVKRKCDPVDGWVDVVLSCPAANSCSTGQCVEGKCTSGASACDDSSDLCNPSVCTDNGCEVQPIVCDSPPNECYVGSCDATTGECKYVTGGCDDGDACTIDVCESGVCTNTPVVCDDGDGCSTDICNPSTGLCEFSAPNCDDGIECTLDECNNGVCTHVARDSLCNDGDSCKEGTCSLSDGCVFTNFTCTQDNDFCTTDVCISYEGCSTQTIDCLAVYQTENPDDKKATDCKVHFCNAEEQICSFNKLDCNPDNVAAIAVAAGVSTVVVVGIVVGIVIALACGGGAVYAITQNTGVGSASVVANNPLYQGQGTQGINPLNRA